MSKATRFCLRSAPESAAMWHPDPHTALEDAAGFIPSSCAASSRTDSQNCFNSSAAGSRKALHHPSKNVMPPVASPLIEPSIRPAIAGMSSVSCVRLDPVLHGELLVIAGERGIGSPVAVARHMIQESMPRAGEPAHEERRAEPPGAVIVDSISGVAAADCGLGQCRAGGRGPKPALPVPTAPLRVRERSLCRAARRAPFGGGSRIPI